MVDDDKAFLKDPEGILTCLRESFKIGPMDIVLVPELGIIQSPFGSVSLPAKYEQYPQLALFYFSLVLGQSGMTSQDLHLNFEWPEPYVVLNTLIKRIEKHSFVTDNGYKKFPDFIKEQIAPSLECPNDQLVPGTITDFERSRKQIVKVRFEHNDNIVKDTNDFFMKLTDLPTVLSLFQHHTKLDVKISCRAWMQSNPAELERFGKAIRKVWLYESIISGAEQPAKDNVAQETSSTSESSTPDSTNQHDLISPSESVSDPSMFWELLGNLEQSWVPHRGEDGVRFKLSQYVEKDPATFEEMKKRRLTAKNNVYGFVRQIMYSTGLVRIYRGVRCKPNGVLKVSLFYSSCKWVTSMWVTLVPITLRESDTLEDIDFIFNCSLNLKSAKES